ncbi:Protein MOS2, partial [Ananas comosus]
MKLSFSLSSKPSSRANSSRAPAAADDDEGREFVTVFDPSQTLAADARSRLVIPPIPNADYLFHPPKKAKYMPPLPSSAADADDPSAAAKFVLDTSGEGPASHIAYGLTLRSGSAADPKPSPDDRRIPNRRSRGGAEDSILRRYKEDMKTLPEDRGFDEFRTFAVEGFGAALLAGYGWSEGKGIGRNNTKGDTNVVQYDRRAGTTGLGYNPSTADPKKKRGEWVFKNDNKDKDRDRESDKVRASKDERREQKKRKKDVSLGRKSSTSGNKRRRRRARTDGSRATLRREDCGCGGPTMCDISMDESRELVQGVDQDMLETAIPKRGGSVLVLYGKHKGVYGSLVERNLEDETGVVRDADSHDMFNVRLEQIA